MLGIGARASTQPTSSLLAAQRLASHGPNGPARRHRPGFSCSAVTVRQKKRQPKPPNLLVACSHPFICGGSCHVVDEKRTRRAVLRLLQDRQYGHETHLLAFLPGRNEWRRRLRNIGWTLIATGKPKW